VCRAASERDIGLKTISGFASSPGRGVKADVAGREVLVGTQAWLREMGIELASEHQSALQTREQQGISCVLVAVDGDIKGLLGLVDGLRDDAVQTVKDLLAAGMKVTVLSGDRKAVVEAVTAPLGPVNRQAEVLPRDKSAVIKALQAEGDRVAMVGDGVNDAPALIQADVGIAIASGTDVSVESADVVLSQQALQKVADARTLAARSLRTIRQNIVLSISYNVIMVPMAMMALLSPLIAAITMPISSLLVIANAARIGRVFKKRAG
jgi:Cu2+-exporting ATPase